MAAAPAPADFWTSGPFWAAAGVFSTLVLTKIAEVVLRYVDYWVNRRAAIVRFKVDMRLRNEDLQSKRESFTDPDYQARMIEMIQAYGRDNRKFRFYGVAISDTKARDDISKYLATFPDDTKIFIRNAILLDRQMIAEYEMMTSKAFESLAPDRQIAAFQQWIHSVTRLATCLDALGKHFPVAQAADQSHGVLLKGLLRQRARGG